MGNAEVPGVNHQQQLEQWIARYADAILRVCFIYLRDVSQAEDAVQDTFIKAWRHIGQWNGQGEKAWLMRIAVNTCHDYHRSKWFRHTDMTRELDKLPPQATAAQPEDHALLMDVYELPEKEKQAILLYYYQEMTLQETADCLGISRSAVHKRLRRAQTRLRGRLEGRDFDDE